MRRPLWNTEIGYEMYKEGKSDAQIADEFGISAAAVTTYRKKYWEKTSETVGKDAKQRSTFTLQQVPTVPAAPAAGPEKITAEDAPAAPAQPVPEDPKEEKQGAGQCNFDFTAGLQVPADPAAAADPAPAGEEKPEPVESNICVPERKLDIMEILEAATGHLTGMKAVCTAGAIQHLTYWRYPEDLLRARDHIDYLLDLLHRTEGR